MSVNIGAQFKSQKLRLVPKGLSREHRNEWDKIAILGETYEKVWFCEKMIESYQDSMVKGYFTFKLAGLLKLQGAGFIAMERYREAQEHLLQAGVKDEGLDAYLADNYQSLADHQKQARDQSRLRSYDLPWRPLSEHPFPTGLGRLPPGAQELQVKWRAMVAAAHATSSASSPPAQTNPPPSSVMSSTSIVIESPVPNKTAQAASPAKSNPKPPPINVMDAYMRKVAIESNHVEETFRVVPESMSDLIRRGIKEGEGRILCYPFSAIQQPSAIRDILQDTLEAYKLAQTIASSPELLNKKSICDIHARLMRTAAFWGDGYSNPGMTRTRTRKTVTIVPVSASCSTPLPMPRIGGGGPGGNGFVNGYSGRTTSKSYNIEYCPYDEVDEQLDVFCEIAKRCLKDEKWHNPFALASWLHMSLAACHPFDDGNGRVARIVASIPLLAAEYPPFSLTLARRREYYAAIHRAHLEQDHAFTVRSIMEGMKETLRDLDWILSAPVR